MTGKRDPAWTEMKGGLAAADTRRHLPRRAGGPAAGMSLSPRAAPRPCRASSSLPAGEPPAPHAPAQSPRGLLTERGQGPDLRPSRPPAPCQQIPCALTHPRVLTACSGLTHMLCPVPKTTSPGNLLVFPIPLSLPGRAHPSLVLPAWYPARCLPVHPSPAVRTPLPPFSQARGRLGDRGATGGTRPLALLSPGRGDKTCARVPAQCLLGSPHAVQGWKRGNCLSPTALPPRHLPPRVPINTLPHTCVVISLLSPRGNRSYCFLPASEPALLPKQVFPWGCCRHPRCRIPAQCLRACPQPRGSCRKALGFGGRAWAGY